MKIEIAVVLALLVSLGGCAVSHSREDEAGIDAAGPPDADTGADAPSIQDAALDPNRVCGLKCAPSPECEWLNDDRPPTAECIEGCLNQYEFFAARGCGDEMLASIFCIATEPRIDCAASTECSDEGDRLEACVTAGS